MQSPFDSGKTLIFKTMALGGVRYLNSSPATSEVNLANSTSYISNMGTHYEVTKMSDGSYTLKTLSTSGPKRYVDSLPGAPSRDQMVFLSQAVDGKHGTHWKPELQVDGLYTLRSMSIAASADRYLDSWPRSPTPANVYLSSVGHFFSVGSHWNVGVDSYTTAEVVKIVDAYHSGLKKVVYKSDSFYHPMEYSTLKEIWDSSGLSGFRYKKDKFDSDDFAVCFKAAVAQWCYKESAQAPKAMSCLCGILWATKPGDVEHQFNFSVDPFGAVVLFDPQNGQKIPEQNWKPTFCMI